MITVLTEILGLAGYAENVLSASVAGLLVGHALQRWFGFFVILTIAAYKIPWIRSRFT